jgi:hypothetical protein
MEEQQKMKKILLTIGLFLALAGSAQALTLSWGKVTTGTNGQPLANGAEVKSYKVYQCVTGQACTKDTGRLIATVAADVFILVIDGEPVPRNYIVTAVNVVGEGAPSNVMRVLIPNATSAEVVQ